MVVSINLYCTDEIDVNLFMGIGMTEIIVIGTHCRDYRLYLFHECLHGDMSNYPFVYRNSLVHEFVFFRNSILHEFVLLLEFASSVCTDVGALQILTLFSI